MSYEYPNQQKMQSFPQTMPANPAVITSNQQTPAAYYGQQSMQPMNPYAQSAVQQPSQPGDYQQMLPTNAYQQARPPRASSPVATSMPGFVGKIAEQRLNYQQVYGDTNTPINFGQQATSQQPPMPAKLATPYQNNQPMIATTNGQQSRQQPLTNQFYQNSPSQTMQQSIQQAQSANNIQQPSLHHQQPKLDSYQNTQMPPSSQYHQQQQPKFETYQNAQLPPAHYQQQNQYYNQQATPRPPPMPTQQYPQQSMPYDQAPQRPMSGGYGQTPSYQPRTIDPESMPSVVQVIEEDLAKFETGMFVSSKPATLPPLSTTLYNGDKFVCHDGGAARPIHIRSSLYMFPSTEDLLKTSNIPLCVFMKPFAEDELDETVTVPVTNSEIIRCNRCKAYMNPYMRFIDGGRRFQCVLCHHITEVPSSYFAHLDHNGQRLDVIERPELYLGSYEFRATEEYCRKSTLNCRRPHIIFAFELTLSSRPMIQQIAQHLPDVIRHHLPVDLLNPGSPPPMVGFLTYNSKIQLYDLVHNCHIKVICDVADTYPPFTTFLVDPITHAEKIESFLKSLPSLCSEDELERETILGPVIEAALRCCQVDKNNWTIDANMLNSNATKDPNAQIKDPLTIVSGGKVYLFHCTLPTWAQEGVNLGVLKPRWTTTPEEASKLLGTDKEKTVLCPEPSKYYVELAERCYTNYGSGVELFLFPPLNGPFLDVATLSELVRLTGSGGIFKYYNDQSHRFITDLKYSLKSSFAFDATIKGASYMITLKHDEKLPEDEFVTIQTAVLYTALSGERRVRVHNIAFSVGDQLADLYRNSCLETIVNYLFRSNVYQMRLGLRTVQQAKDNIMNSCIGILSAYRNHCVPSGSIGQLVLPETCKLLPVYVTGMLKCDAIDGGPGMMIDDKAYAQIRAVGSTLELSQVTLYPKLLKVEYDDAEPGELVVEQIRCASFKMNNEAAVAYILENGLYCFLLLVTSNAKSPQFIRNTFGVDNVHQIHLEDDLPQLLTVESQFVRKLIEDISKQRRSTIKVHIIRQGIDKSELVFKNFLYEDSKISASPSDKYGSVSYIDILCFAHKEIKARLSD